MALVTFSAFLFQNNAGIPVVILLLLNGLMLGAMCAVFAGQDLTVGFLGWLATHGTTELLAIVLCGGEGFYLGDGRTRLAALAERGGTAAALVIGAVAMLLIVAVLEGLGRQLIQETWLRFAIGGLMLAF